MPQTKFVNWTHGTAMQLEYPNRVTGVRHAGPFVRIEGSAGQNTWGHFVIPMPSLQEGKPIQASRVLLKFRARPHGALHEIALYDGENQIAYHTNLNLRGEHLDAAFEVPGQPAVNQGLNVTVGVVFDANPPDVRSTWIEIVAVGVEFVAGSNSRQRRADHSG